MESKVTLCPICLNCSSESTDYKLVHLKTVQKDNHPRHDKCISHFHLSCLQTYLKHFTSQLYCLSCEEPLDAKVFNNVKKIQSKKLKKKKEDKKESKAN